MTEFMSSFLRYFGAVSIFLLTLVIAHWMRVLLLDRKRLPPGPFPFPIIGNLLSLGRRIDKSLFKIGKTFDDVFTVYFGGIPFVVLNTYGTIRDAFLKQGANFTGRPNFVMFEMTSNKQGVVMSDGDVWKLHRKILMTLLRDFGFGKSSMEDKIREECGMLIKEITKENGNPLNLHYPLAKSVSNIICSIIYGQRFEYDDTTFHTLIERYDLGIRLMGEGAIVNFINFLRYMPGDMFNLNYIKKTDILTTNFNKMLIENRIKTFDPNNIEIFIDAYIDSLHKHSQRPEESEQMRTQMAKVFNDFFGAGTETTSTTLRWAILYCLHHSDYMSRIQTEIDDVIGRDGVPSMTQMRSMPFTEAFLCEALRLGNITPVGMMHVTTKDVTLHGFNIPADTVVVPNMRSVFFDPEVYPNPEQFYPQRFLSEDGKVVKPESFIPFGIGKRVCIGEALARMELFIFFTMLLQKFTFKLPEGVALPDREGILSITLTPVPYKVCAVKR